MNSYFSKTTFMSGADQSVSKINVTGADNIYTAPLPMGWAKEHALYIKAEGAAIDVNVIFELGDELPENYNAADDVYGTYEGYSSPTKNITLAGIYRIKITPVVAKYIRILLDGQAGNHATTTYLTVSLCKILGS